MPRDLNTLARSVLGTESGQQLLEQLINREVVQSAPKDATERMTGWHDGRRDLVMEIYNMSNTIPEVNDGTGKANPNSRRKRSIN